MNSRIYPDLFITLLPHLPDPFKPIEYNFFQTYVIFYETPFN